MTKKKPKNKPRHTTVWVLQSTNKKILRAKKESEYILSSDQIISKAMDEYLKMDPKKIEW